MLNLTKLYTTPSPKLEKWEKRIKSSNPEIHFLLLLLPLMEYVFLHLKAARETHPKLNAWINDELLIALTLQLFISRANIMIIRICVLEMHVASKAQLLAGETPQQRFEFFLKILQDPENALDLINKYPVLQKQLNIFIQQILTIFSEFFARLAQDHEELMTIFFANDSNYILTAIQPSGDRHRQGHAVMILEFSKEDKKTHLLYKPKSLAMDIAFQNFIGWYNQKTETLKLLPFKNINKKEYGWCEFVPHIACQNKTDVKEFYYRAGIWMMLTYLFRGSDIHSENMLAHGAYPVVVDFECLFTPFFLKKVDKNPSLPRFSVLGTLFLPRKEVINKEHKGYDISALGGEEGGESFYPAIKWLEAGKDTMHAERLRRPIQALLNKPALANEKIDFLEYEEDFLQGFTETYQLILRNKIELLSENSPLKQFQKTAARVVLRGTSEYSVLLLESWHPKFLYRFKDRRKYFLQLKKNIAHLPYYKYVIAAELNDLEQDTIPFFSALSSSKKIVDSNGKAVKLPVIKSGYAAVYEHIQQVINEEDLLVQKTVAKNSFIAAKLNQELGKIIAKPLPLQETATPSFEILQKRALNIARRELNKIAKLKVISGKNIYWPCIDLGPNKIWQATTTDLNLYNGIGGIGLTFAYAAEIFHDKEYLQIAQLCLSTLRDSIRKEHIKDWQKAKVGGFEGIGSILYVLSGFYRLWHDETLKNDMKRVLKVLPLALKNDKTLDIIAGAAGTLAVLNAMQGIFSKAKLLPAMRLCANHLLKQYPKPNECPLATEIVPGIKPLLGFSHGVTGMAWALHHYYLLEPRVDIKQWIETSLAYERAEFNPAEGNWPDFRENEKTGKQNPPMTAWCHGAPGIGLARLDIAKQQQDAAIIDEVKIALATTEKKGFSNYQCLCHGSLGNLELFLSTSQVWQDPELTQRYYKIAVTLLNFLEENNFPYDQIGNPTAPGLMTGAAGVAYQMLRIAFPEKIPAILLLK